MSLPESLRIKFEESGSSNWPKDTVVVQLLAKYGSQSHGLMFEALVWSQITAASNELPVTVLFSLQTLETWSKKGKNKTAVLYLKLREILVGNYIS